MNRLHTLFFAPLIVCLACTNQPNHQQSLDQPTAEVSSAANKNDDWEILFDGQRLDRWRSVKSDTFPSRAWVIEDDALVLNGKGGDIITKDKYSDFELVWEFKLTPEANSGIKYFVDTLVHQETGEVAFNGPEYQIIDDTNHEAIKDDPNGLSSSASLYLLYAPEDKMLHPAGEWNEGKIIAKGNQVEHWLNGTMVVRYERGSDDFFKRKSQTKFKAYTDYGQVKEGHILITDHQDKVYFRNIKIRRL
ncbi:MAG TPA: DUF1080 domain-containing protein [Cyclobacteriaceae bacterium]|nr:DUF1080 domain-containing protein [Cyclobacteriaceae bacterium]